MKVECQVCDQLGHSTIECQFMYSPCKEPTCDGIRLLGMSKTASNQGRKYLRCQHQSCRSYLQWLDEAISDTLSGIGSSSSTNECFKCDQAGHWMDECPWVDCECNKKDCNGKRTVKITKYGMNVGKKYLKCARCGGFEWLHDALKKASRKKAIGLNAEPIVTLKMTLSEFSKLNINGWPGETKCGECFAVYALFSAPLTMRMVLKDVQLGEYNLTQFWCLRLKSLVPSNYHGRVGPSIDVSHA